MQLKSTDVITVCGQRGTGKSTVVRMIAVKAKRVVVYDPLFEHARLGVVVRSPQELGNIDRVVYQPLSDTDENFEAFCREVWVQMSNRLCIVDEVDVHANNYQLPEYFGRIIRLGRHKGIGCIGITRRIANVNKTLPALSHHIISFRQELPNDVKYLADFMGWKNAAKLRELPDFYYLHYDFKTAEIQKTVKMDSYDPIKEKSNAPSAEVKGRGDDSKSAEIDKSTKEQQPEPPKDDWFSKLFG